MNVMNEQWWVDWQFEIHRYTQKYTKEYSHVPNRFTFEGAEIEHFIERPEEIKSLEALLQKSKSQIVALESTISERRNSESLAVENSIQLRRVLSEQQQRVDELVAEVGVERSMRIEAQKRIAELDIQLTEVDSFLRSDQGAYRRKHDSQA